MTNRGTRSAVRFLLRALDAAIQLAQNWLDAPARSRRKQ